MLVVHGNDGKHVLDNVYDFYIVNEYEGNKTLYFSMSPKDELYVHIQAESRITYGDCRYIVKQINERSNAVSVVCDLDMDDWKQNLYMVYAPMKAMSLADLINDIPVNGWEVQGADGVKESVTISLENVTKYQILMEAKKWFNITYEIHNEPKDGIKKIIIKNNQQSVNKGVYLSEELNLSKLEVKSDSTNLITRLYPYSINGENTITIQEIVEEEYIENLTYTDQIISAVWMTEGYSSAQDLHDAAVEYLKILSMPKQEFSCYVVDLAKINSDYSMLELCLHDRVTLLDTRRKQSLEFMIVQYTEYPYEPHRNVIKLSSDYKKIDGTNQGKITIDKNVTVQTVKNHQYENNRTNDNTVDAIRITDIWSEGSSAYSNSTLHKQTNEYQNVEVSKERKISIDEISTRNIQTMSFLQDINGTIRSICNRVLTNDSEVSCQMYYCEWNDKGMVLRSVGIDEAYKNQISQTGYRVLENDRILFGVDKDKLTTKYVELDNHGSIKIGPFILQHRTNGHLTLKKGE